MVSQDFRRQLEGYGLTTANILYRRPDHPWLLQTYVWQDYDLCPMFPHLNTELLAGKARRPAALGHRGACALDQAGRNSGDRRRVQAALTSASPIGDLISPESRPLFDCGYLNGRLGNFEFLGFLILTEPEKGLPQIAKVKCGVMASGNVNRAKTANFQPG